MKVSIGRAARELGVSRELLRRWEATGNIQVERAPNGRRRYDLESLRRWVPKSPVPAHLTVAYARVSSEDQVDVLDQQTSLLESFCNISGWKFEVIKDIGSGLNFHNRGLRDLVRRICSGEVSRLVITHKDRLLRFGAELVLSLCEQFETEVVIINAPQDAAWEDELVSDVVEIFKVFSTRMHGNGGGDPVQVRARLTEAAEKAMDAVATNENSGGH